MSFIVVGFDADGDVIFGADRQTAKMPMKQGATGSTIPLGYTNSDVREYCINTFYNMLPDNVKTALLSKERKYATITGTTSSNYRIDTISDSIFIPNRAEVFGSNVTNHIGASELNEKPFEWYTANPTETINSLHRSVFAENVNSTYIDGWLASINYKQANNPPVFFCVNYGGTTSSSKGTTGTYGVVPHFIIGAQ